MPPDESLELFPSEASHRPPAPSVDARDGGGASQSGSQTSAVPLAERLRPRHLDEVVGQEKLLAPGAALRALADAGRLPSLILWGPPGCGKTTLAQLLAHASGAKLEMLSAVMAGVKEIRAVFERAARSRELHVLFLDEIHRLNRAQQDALLPHVERGTVTLIGATTENPSFEVIAPLLSRCRVFVLERLDTDALEQLVRRAVDDPERGLGGAIGMSDEIVRGIAGAADGDARRALGILETAVSIARQADAETTALTEEAVRQAVGRRTLLHDRDRDEHYQLSSAFIKSLRASDPDAALYYAARLLAAGDDPFFLARRLVIFASEDIGNADPQALGVATAAYQALERIGMPEGRIPLAQAITHLACAPKSNAAYRAIGRAFEAVERHGAQPVPLHLRNAPTALMKGQGYGRDYEYPHDAPDGFVARPNLPDAVTANGDPSFYRPSDAGAEAAVAARLAEWRRRRDDAGE